MNYQVRLLSFGEVWGEAFNLYMDNFFPLSIIAALSYIPYFFITFPANAQDPQPSDMLYFLIFIALSMMLSSLSSALMLEYVSKRYLGKSQTLSDYLNSVLPIIFPIMGLSLLIAMIVGIGMVALIVPGVFCALALSIAVEILIVERKGVMHAIARSFHLTKGEKGEIFMFTLLIMVLTFAFQQLLTMIFKALNVAQLEQLVLMISQILLAPLGASIFILVYFNIRIKKEGFHLEHMVEQFPDTTSE